MDGATCALDPGSFARLAIAAQLKVIFTELGAVKKQVAQIIRGGCSNSTRRETHCVQS